MIFARGVGLTGRLRQGNGPLTSSRPYLHYEVITHIVSIDLHPTFVCYWK
jgi:hypothetical protein